MLELVAHTLVYVTGGLNLVIIRQTVHLMDEHLERDVRVHLVRLGYGDVKLGERLHVVVLRVDHKDKRPAPSEDLVRIEGRIEEVNLPRKVPDLKLNKGAVRDVCKYRV